MIVYFNGVFTPKENVRISPDDRGYLFADGTYEVIRIYRGKLFRLEDHLGRFANSLKQIRLDFEGLPAIKRVAEELIERNGMQTDEASLYIQITRGVGPRRHPFPEPGTPPTVYACVSAVVPPADKWRTGVKVILVPDTRWSRCDIKSVSLLANVLAAQTAKERKADEAIFVRNGWVTEGTHTNVCAVFDGKVRTHPAGTAILDGITREVVRGICPELGVQFVERPVSEAQFPEADEIFLLGTTTEVMPVVHVGAKPVGSGSPGSLTRRIQDAFFQKTRGHAPV